MGADKFLTTVFDQAQGVVLTCNARFITRRWKPGDKIPDDHVYFCISTVRDPNPRQLVGLSRKAQDLVLTYDIVLDDVGTKVSRETLAGLLAPSERIETSEGNEQWHYFLEEGVEPARAAALVEALAAKGLTDPGAKGAARVMRFPGSLNSKYDPPFVARSLGGTGEYHSYTDICRGLGVVPTDTPALNISLPVLPDGMTDPVVAILAEEGLILGPPNSSGWIPITCPLEHEHTGEIDHGTDYKPGMPGVFKCLHSHGELLPTSWFRDWLRERRPDADLSLIPGEALKAIGRKLASVLGPVPAQDGAKAPAGSEDAVGLVVGDLHHHELRYVAQMGQWFRWDGCRWAEDRTIEVFDLIRPYVRAAAFGHKSEGQQRAAARAAIVAGVEKFVRSDRRIAAVVGDFDDEPYLLNTPDGIVDLMTGEMSGCDPARMCTKSTAVGPAAPGTPALRFTQFLMEITGIDADAAEKRSYMQRLAGYALVGDNPEEAFFFGAGTGANGKSVFMNTLRGIMADYCVVASSELFLASRMERHPTELAELRGARLVIASELDQGQRWNEARIKSLTGDTHLKGRRMREDFFEYRRSFKPFVVGNYRPNLRNVDEAMRRRMHLVPFTVTIAREQREAGLTRALEQEWPAILRWAIEGCLEWQRIGLAPPKCITAASEEYMSEQDLIGQWLVDDCQIDRSAETSSTELFMAWRDWANRREEYVGTHKYFVGKLQDRGFDLHHGRAGNVFRGLKINKLGFGTTDKVVPLLSRQRLRRDDKDDENDGADT
jgi:P4 family phage/plasmid primase-like protien